MNISFRSQAVLLALAAFVGAPASAAHVEDRPAQGVFMMSNRAPENEVASYRSLPDGSLSYIGAYATGGVGNPDPNDAFMNDDLSSSNSLTYHFWKDTQFLTAVNAGDNTISLLEVHPMTLELTLHQVAELEGIYPCSITAFEDRICAVDCAGDIMVECFRIVAEDGPNDASSYSLEADFVHDFGFNVPQRFENRENSGFAALGPGNILFSGDGLQLGIVMKGNAAVTAEEIAAGFTVPPAGFWSFPVSESGYGNPAFFKLPDASLPFAFSWRSGEEGTTNQIVLVVNASGEFLDFPELIASFSSVTSLQVISSSNSDGTSTELAISKVDEVNINAVAGCWIEYRFAHWYTGNFVDDTISIGSVTRSGELEFVRTVPIGAGTLPGDVVQMGTKLDGSFYLYTENHGTDDIGIHEVLEHGHIPQAPFDGGFTLQTKASAPLPTGALLDRSWQGATGIAATTLSEQQLYDIYGYHTHGETDDHSETEELELMSETTSSSASMIQLTGIVSSLLLSAMIGFGI